MGVFLDTKTGELGWASGGGGGSSLPNTPLRMISTDSSGDPVDDVWQASPFSVEPGPGFFLYGAKLQPVGFSRIGLGGIDATAVGGGEAFGFLMKSGLTSSFVAVNEDTLQSYFSLLKSDTDEVQFFVSQDGSSYQLLVDPNGFKLGSGVYVNSIEDDLTSDSSDAIPTVHAAKNYTDTAIAAMPAAGASLADFVDSPTVDFLEAPDPAKSSDVGKTSDGGSSISSGSERKRASKFTVTTTGQVQSMHMRFWVSAGSQNLKGLIYSDNAGSADALLAVTDVLNVTSTSETVQDLVFSGSNKINLTPGDYWFGYNNERIGGNSSSISTDSTTNGSVTNTNTYASGPSNPFGSTTTVNGILDVYVTVNEWSISAKAKNLIVTKTANYTATTSDKTILCDATSGAITILLPTAASAYDATTLTGQILNIKKIDSSVNTVTLDADGSELIQALGAPATTQVITLQGEALTIQSNGVGWYAI